MGRAERFNLTLATQWSYARLYLSNQVRLDALPGWLYHYTTTALPSPRRKESHATPQQPPREPHLVSR